MNNFLAWSHVPCLLGLLLGCEGIRTKAAAPHRNYISHTRALTLVSMASFPWPIAIKFSLTVGVIEMLNSISTEWVGSDLSEIFFYPNLYRYWTSFGIFFLFHERRGRNFGRKFRERNFEKTGKDWKGCVLFVASLVIEKEGRKGILDGEITFRINEGNETPFS